VLIFACPALMDLVIFLVYFAVFYSAGRSGLTDRECAWIGGIFQLTYMATSLGIGWILKRQNARAFLVVGLLTCITSGIWSITVRHYVPVFAGMACFGVAAAFFFNAFQTFMRGDAPPGGLARATGLYTLAWSGGSSLGVLLSGSLYNFGSTVLIVLTLGVGGLISFLLFRHQARPESAPSADEMEETGPAGSAPVHGAYVGVAWLIIFTAMFVQRPIQTFYPALCAGAQIAPWLAGLPLFLHMFIQALAGAGMIPLRFLLYRKAPLILIQGAAAGLLILIGWHPSIGYLAIGMSLLGIWAGFAYFSAVYYASNSGNRSRNIGVNECLVGLGSFAGLILSEYFMKKSGNPATMYWVCASALGISIILQCAVAWAGTGRFRTIRGAPGTGRT
jgi:predicted MFS family arabinose efflux permease